VAAHPHQGSQPRSGNDIGKPWGSPRPITPIPSDPSATEQPFFCFIAHAAPVPTCNPTPQVVTVTLGAGTISESGGSTTATVTVTDVEGDQVLVTDPTQISFTPESDVTIGTVTCNTQSGTQGYGTCSAPVAPSATACPTGCSVTITATYNDGVDPPISGSAPLNLKPGTTGAASSVSVALASTTINADGGTSSTTATATVDDAGGAPVVGQEVQFSASPGASSPHASVTIAPTICTTDANGHCTAQITSGTIPGSVTITATDTSVTSSVVSGTGSLTLTDVAGNAQQMSLQLGASSIPADGTTTTTATATVTGNHGLPVIGDKVSFASSPVAGVTIGHVTDNQDGTYTATISGTRPGSYTIIATDNSVSPSISSSPATLTLTSTIGPAAKVTVALSNTSIVADGVTSTTATATVTDAAGHPITGDSIQFSATPSGVVIGATSNNGDGTYTANITSSSTPGPVTITATDTSSTALPTAIGSATLNLTSQDAAQSITVAVSPVAIYADGSSHAFATATVTSSLGTGVPGEAVQFYVDGSPVGGVCTTDSNGQCHVTLTASTTVGVESITATDIGANISTQQPAQLTLLTPLPPPPPTSTTPTTTTTPTPTTTTTTPSSTHPHSSRPTVHQILSSLAGVLAPSGSKASIKQILSKGSYTFSYHAPGAGKLTIDWYDGPVGKRPKLIGAVTVAVGKARKLIAEVRLTSAGRSTLKAKLKLTGAGRSTLKAAKAPLKVTSNVSFKAAGESAVSRRTTFMLH